MAIFFGEHTLTESGAVTLKPEHLFNAALLSEGSDIADLGIAIGEAMDVLRENFEEVERLDYVYEHTKARKGNQSVINESYQNLAEGVGEFMGKLKEWLMKMWNSIKSFFSNTWLKLTNKWAYRDKMIKDKEFSAAIMMGKSDHEKWNGKSINMFEKSPVETAATYIGKAVAYIATTEADVISDDIKEFDDELAQRNSVSDADLAKEVDGALAFYHTKAAKSAQLLKKMEASVGKMIDQFLKDIKTGKGADNAETTAYSKLHKINSKDADGNDEEGKMDVGFGKSVAVDDMPENSNKLGAAKRIIPALAKIIHKSAAAIKADADIQWKILQIAARIGGKELSDIKNMR